MSSPRNLFRGLVFDGIREKVEDIKITIVLSALIFGLPPDLLEFLLRLHST